MNIWQMLEWAAWIISGLMLAWMVIDAWRVGQQHSEEMLMSSREGADDLFSEEKRGH